MAPKRRRSTRTDELVEESGGGREESGGRAATKSRGGGGGSNADDLPHHQNARFVRPPSSDENAMPPPSSRRQAGGGAGGGKRGRAAAAAEASDDDDDDDGEPSTASEDRDYDFHSASDLKNPPSDAGVEDERRERRKRRRSSNEGSRSRRGRSGGRGGAAAAAPTAATPPRGRGRPPSLGGGEAADQSAARASCALEAAALDADAVRAAARRLEAAEEAEVRAAANGDDSDKIDFDVDASGRPFVVVGADGREWTRAKGQGLPGQVKQVVLRDFMCHEHFKVDFCPHVNFVSGVNGSGKSALLQALQLALGVRAAATGRASAASSLVRTGASQATIRVELWNTGPDAHRPELFGDTIVIERKLSAVQTYSQFGLKTKAGKVASTAKREINAVLEALSVDAANPVVVMTQDVARSFLGGGGGGGGNVAAPDRGVGTAAASSKKFEVYMKATLLARAEASHAAAADAVAETRRHVEVEATRLKERADKVASLEKSLRRLEAAAALRGETSRCERAIAWAAAKGREAALAVIECRINVTGPAMLSAARARLAQEEEAAAEAQRALDEQGARSDQAATALEEATRAFREAQAEAANAERQRAAAGRAATEALEKETSAQLSRDAALDAAIEASNAIERARMERAKAAAGSAQAEERRRSEALTACAVSTASARSAFLAAEAEVQKASMAVQSAVEEAARRRAKYDAAAAARSSENPAAFFGGDAAVAVVKEVAGLLSVTGSAASSSSAAAAAAAGSAEAKLRGACSGPLGTLVGLSEPRWAAALQATAGPAAATFFATSNADASVLVLLFKKYGMKAGRVAVVDPSIPPHKIDEPLVDGRGAPMKTLLSVLDFSGIAPAAASSSAAAAAASFSATAARNYLIDAFGVEKVVLCETEAKSAARVRGVRAAVLSDGTAFTFRGGTLTGRPAAGGGGWAWRGFYGGAGEARELAEDASRAGREAEEKKRRHAAKKREFEEAKSAWKAANAAKRDARERHEDAKADLARAEAELTAAASGGDGGVGGGGGASFHRDGNSNSSSSAISALEEALREARADAADKQRALEEAAAAAAAAAAQLEEADARKQQLAAAIQNEQGTGLLALSRVAQEARAKLEASQEAARRIEGQMGALGDARHRVAGDAAARRADAEAVCPEVEGDEALAALEASRAFASIDRKLLEAAGIATTAGDGGAEREQGAEAQEEEAEEEEEESDGGSDNDGDKAADERRRERRERKRNNQRPPPRPRNSSSNPAAKLAQVYDLRADLASRRLAKARSGVRDAETAAGGGAEELRAELAAAKPAYFASAARLRTHFTTLRTLENSLGQRLADFKRMDRQVEEAVNRRFVRYMKRKGHLGQVKVNRDTRTLDIKVVVHGSQQQQAGAGNAGGGRTASAANGGRPTGSPPQAGGAATTATTKVKDLRQLSGGERSFTTVCFALALGEFTSCPFRAMDEFDVFMDAVARRTSMASLFENAALTPHLQFVFLTPQDVRAVDEAKKELRDKGIDLPEHYLKVLCMLPPVRGEKR